MADLASIIGAPAQQQLGMSRGLPSNLAGIFNSNNDGTYSYANGPNQTRIPQSYFDSLYQKDMQQYGRIAGPGFIFDQNAPTWDGGAFKMPDTAQGFNGDLYTQDDTGRPIGWSQAEGSRLQGIDSAYQSLLNNKQTTTDFSKFGQHPDSLGSDIMTALAMSGMWIAPGQDMSGRVLQATRNNNGTIQVNDPRGGDGQNPLYNYGADGKYLGTDVGGKPMSYLQGIASVAAAASGFGAIGAATGAGGLGMTAGGVAGVPPPANPFNLGSFLSPQNLMNSVGLPGEALKGINTGRTLLGALGLGGGSPTPQRTGANGMTLNDLFGGFGGGGNNNGGVNGGIGGGGQSFLGGLGQLFGNTNVGSLTNLIPGLVDANQQNKASSQMIDWLGSQQDKMDSQSSQGRDQFMNWLTNQQNTMQAQAQHGSTQTLDWLNGQQQKIDGLYQPGTPEYNQLFDEMSRKDAAAGRNSQYGPRSVEFGAKLAGIRGGLQNQFTGAVAPTLSNAANLPATMNANFTNAATPSVNNSFNQGANQTLNFTTGTSRGLSDALTQRANRFSTLAGGLGMNNPNGSTGGRGVNFGQGSAGGGTGGSAGSILDQLFGGGGSGLDGALNNISDSGFNFLTPGGSFAPTADQADSIFGGNFFGGGINDMFSNSNTMGNFSDLSSDIFDWFR